MAVPQRLGQRWASNRCPAASIVSLPGTAGRPRSTRRVVGRLRESGPECAARCARAAVDRGLPGGGYYSLTARHSGKALDVIGASTGAGHARSSSTRPQLRRQPAVVLARLVVEAPQVTSADAIRFLEQATLGPTRSSSRTCGASASRHSSTSSSTAPLSSYPTLPLYPTTRDTVACPNGSTCQRDNYTIYPLQNRFFINALYGADQLRQRVAFALHQIIVVSGVDITQPSWMAPYLQTARSQRARQLPPAALRDHAQPGDGQLPRHHRQYQDRPNENYAPRDPAALLARHGPAESGRHAAARPNGQPIPAYTQDTVNNFARVFTGWRLATAPATGVPNYIDPMVANRSAARRRARRPC